MVNKETTPKRDSKTAIFEAAAQEFAERGFDAAGVDRIAAAAGVNKAMLYYHFTNKRALYLEVLRDMFRAVGAKARAIADGTGTPDEKLDAWIATIIQEAAGRPWFPPIMLRELASGAPRLDPETFAMMNAVFGAVRDIIRQGQDTGRFDPAADPLLTHLTILPPVLIFFARERALAATRETPPMAEPRLLAEPRNLEQFVRHMQRAARRMLAHG